MASLPLSSLTHRSLPAPATRSSRVRLVESHRAQQDIGETARSSFSSTQGRPYENGDPCPIRGSSRPRSCSNQRGHSVEVPLQLASALETGWKPFVGGLPRAVLGRGLMRNWIAGTLIAILAVASGAGVVGAQGASPVPERFALNVEVRVWQDVNDARSIYVSARSENGSWRTIPLTLDDGRSSSGRFRYEDISVDVPVGTVTTTVEVRVWQDVNDALSIYVSARPEDGSWRTLGTIPLPLDDGQSSSGRHRYGDITLVATLAPINIPDAGLRAAVEEHLGKAPSAPIFPHEMATLRELDAHNRQIRSLEGLQYATGLVRLDAGRDPRGNEISDLSPLAGLGDLAQLLLGWNNVSDLSPLVDLKSLRHLYVPGNAITDLSPLSAVDSLTVLSVFNNYISDLSPLSNLNSLRILNAEGNRIFSISPLVMNLGLGTGDEVGIERNPLDQSSIESHIPALRARGVDVTYEESFLTASDGPKVYDDIVFVLPVTSVTEEVDIPAYVAMFYQIFEDEFDFLLIVSNLRSVTDSKNRYYGRYFRYKNSIQGIGVDIFSEDEHGQGEKLQSVVHFPYRAALGRGPALHEVMHNWANYAIPTAVRSHWGFSSADGQLGGFNIEFLMNHGDGQYSAGRFGTFANGGNSIPYSPIELYLAGFIPPEDVPDLWVAEDGEWLRGEDGGVRVTDDGDRLFIAHRVKTYSVEDIIAELGPRIPDHRQAQRDFRAAAILLIDEQHPATKANLEQVSSLVSWFSYPGEDESSRYNFYEATGGRGTITMGGLSQFQERLLP